MLKKLVSFLLVFVLILSFSACGKNETPSDSTVSDVTSSDTSSEALDPSKLFLNVLTGETNVPASSKGKKPYAITVNNIRVAQKVQCGLDKADIVFETEVEGGITRLLAVFADPGKIEKVGTVRSLRVVFAELAAGLDSVLFYHGIDKTYCQPLLDGLGISSYQIGNSSNSFRDNNGLAQEHTLFTNGKLLSGVVDSAKLNDKGSDKTWVSFRDSADKKAPGEQKAENIEVFFSGTTRTQFVYDKDEQKYARARKGEEYTDALSGNRELFTNVFVLKTSISDYPDGYHRKISLEGGEGYYASAGGIVPIKWSKGDSKESFKFTYADGKELTVNQGNSYVCIMSDKKDISFN